MWKREDEHTCGHYFRFIHRPAFKTRNFWGSNLCPLSDTKLRTPLEEPVNESVSDGPGGIKTVTGGGHRFSIRNIVFEKTRDGGQCPE
jgi:hypothetical protein